MVTAASSMRLPTACIPLPSMDAIAAPPRLAAFAVAVAAAAAAALDRSWFVEADKDEDEAPTAAVGSIVFGAAAAGVTVVAVSFSVGCVDEVDGGDGYCGNGGAVGVAGAAGGANSKGGGGGGATGTPTTGTPTTGGSFRKVADCMGTEGWDGCRNRCCCCCC